MSYEKKYLKYKKKYLDLFEQYGGQFKDNKYTFSDNKPNKAKLNIITYEVNDSVMYDDPETKKSISATVVAPKPNDYEYSDKNNKFIKIKFNEGQYINEEKGVIFRKIKKVATEAVPNAAPKVEPEVEPKVEPKVTPNAVPDTAPDVTPNAAQR